MKSSDLNNIKEKAVALLKHNDVVRAGIFGSFARGEAKKNSDIDILIKFKGRKSLLDLVRVERELGEIIGRKADVVEYCAINPKLRDRILKEEVKIL